MMRATEVSEAARCCGFGRDHVAAWVMQIRQFVGIRHSESGSLPTGSPQLILTCSSAAFRSSAASLACSHRSGHALLGLSSSSGKVTNVLVELGHDKLLALALYGRPATSAPSAHPYPSRRIEAPRSRSPRALGAGFDARAPTGGPRCRRDNAHGGLRHAAPSAVMAFAWPAAVLAAPPLDATGEILTTPPAPECATVP